VSLEDFCRAAVDWLVAVALSVSIMARVDRHA
jgi:hypothetical protein